MPSTAPGQRAAQMSGDDVRAAAQTYAELGPEYQDAVVESFLDRVTREIDSRVDARIAQQPSSHPFPPRRHGGHGGSAMGLAIVSMVLGIPISAIAVAAGKHPAGVVGLIVVWAAIAIINVAYSLSSGARRLSTFT